MKTSFVQIFDQKDDAESALGYISGAYPKHNHTLIKSSNQVQVWSKVGDESTVKTFGQPDDKIIYLVLSIAPF